VPEFTNYCQIPNDALFEKNEVEIIEFSVEELHNPVQTVRHSTPDLVLRCNDCAALVPQKHVEDHERFHQRLQWELGVYHA